MYAYQDLTARLAMQSDVPANDQSTAHPISSLRPSVTVRADSVAASTSGARLISFGPCVSIQPIEIEDEIGRAHV